MWREHHPKRHMMRFKYASEGIYYVLKTQANFRVHLVMAYLVILAAWWFQFTRIEWIILIGTIGAILALEMINTIFEVVVDHLWQEEHPKAKIIKDVAAGTVFVAAIGAMIIGLFLFVPYVVPMVLGYCSKLI